MNNSDTPDLFDNLTEVSTAELSSPPPPEAPPPEPPEPLPDDAAPLDLFAAQPRPAAS